MLIIVTLVDAGRAPVWLADLLAELDASEFAQLTIFEVEGGQRDGRANAVFRAYEQLDRRLLPAPNDALAAAELPRTAGALRAEWSDGGRLLQPDALEEVRSSRPDVVLDFAGGDLRQLAVTATHGAWTVLLHSPESSSRGPVAFWETLDRQTVLESALVAASPGIASSTLVLCRSFTAVDPTSLQRTRNRLLWKTRRFVVRRLRELYERGWEELEAKAEPVELPTPVDRVPAVTTVVRRAAGVAAGVVGRRVRRLGFRDPWFIALRARTAESVRRTVTGTAPAAGFRPILAAADTGFADPFLFSWDGSRYLFFERYSYAERRGSLWCCELGLDGSPGRAEPVLEARQHLSYPQVFAVDGKVYLLPESVEQGRIQLYECEAFPGRWNATFTLLDGVRAVDPTVLEHDGRFWLFVNLFDQGASPDDELFLFSSSALGGPWVAHPSNPIVSDVRRARGAGRIVRVGGMLVRPAQDCSRTYGSAIIFSRIDTLTATDYMETPIGRLDPSWLPGLSATHTYGFDDRFEVVDGRRLRARASRRFAAGTRR